MDWNGWREFYGKRKILGRTRLVDEDVGSWPRGQGKSIDQRKPTGRSVARHLSLHYKTRLQHHPGDWMDKITWDGNIR